MTWIRERRLGLVYRDPALSHEAFTLFSSARGRHADLLDHGGRIVHQWRHPEGIQHLKLLANGNLLVHTLPPDSAEGLENVGGSAGALLELNQQSEVVWEHRDPYLHHDFHRLANGNTLVVRWARIPPDVSDRVQGGIVGATDPEWMWGDVISEIDADGRTVTEWRSWEHLATEHHHKCPLETRKEWTHLNSLEVGPDGDWLVSFRLTDTIAIVDGTTGDLRWRFGPGILSHQHHATWLDNGNVLVFDNGVHRRDGPSYSQIVEIDPGTSTIVWTYRSEPIVAFFSFMVSGAQRLANGNTFVTEGATGRLFEITPAGETVWEYVSPWILPSRFGPTSIVFRAYRIDVDDPRLDGLALTPEPYGGLNQRIAASQVLGAEDEAVDDL